MVMAQLSAASIDSGNESLIPRQPRPHRRGRKAGQGGSGWKLSRVNRRCTVAPLGVA